MNPAARARREAVRKQAAAMFEESRPTTQIASELAGPMPGGPWLVSELIERLFGVTYSRTRQARPYDRHAHEHGAGAAARHYIAFLDQAHQRLRAPIVLVWDNLNRHDDADVSLSTSYDP
jgi:hypothetical protein